MKRHRSILSGTVSFNNFFLNPAVKRRRFTAGFKKKFGVGVGAPCSSDFNSDSE